jgi:hypothetical protein
MTHSDRAVKIADAICGMNHDKAYKSKWLFEDTGLEDNDQNYKMLVKYLSACDKAGLVKRIGGGKYTFWKRVATCKPDDILQAGSTTSAVAKKPKPVKVPMRTITAITADLKAAAQLQQDLFAELETVLNVVSLLR